MSKQEKRFIIQWVNKYSKETGYVRKVNTKGKYFENTFVASEAKIYKSRPVAKRELDRLISYGEAENNDFHIVEI